MEDRRAGGRNPIVRPVEVRMHVDIKEHRTLVHVLLDINQCSDQASEMMMHMLLLSMLSVIIPSAFKRSMDTLALQSTGS